MQEYIFFIKLMERTNEVFLGSEFNDTVLYIPFALTFFLLFVAFQI